jgi:hypothetical protein
MFDWSNALVRSATGLRRPSFDISEDEWLGWTVFDAPRANTAGRCCRSSVAPAERLSEALHITQRSVEPSLHAEGRPSPCPSTRVHPRLCATVALASVDSPWVE